MAKRGGKVHVAVTRRHYKGTEYKTTLLRRSYRENGKVRNETVGNLSHLEEWMIDGLRAMLAGRRLVGLDHDFEIVRSLPHGHVAAVLGVLRELDLDRLLSRERCRERELCVAMIVQQVLKPGSKLAPTRRYSTTRLLYDLSSIYVEGRCCPLVKLGYSRDKVKGKLQITYGLTCSPEGRPVAIGVHEGNITDQQTLPDAVHAVTERFGIEHVVVVGDRGMLTQAHANTLTQQGIEFITALKAVQVRALVESGELQPSLFDEQNLAEITSELYPSERLVVCRNPAVAAQRARKRESMLSATETELDKVRTMVSGPRGTLRNATAGKIGERAGKVSNKYKMAKHFELQIADGSFSYQRKTEQITAEAALDGFYVIRTTCHHPTLTSPAVVRAYKQLKMAERAFRTIKDTLEIRPIRHHLEDRVRAHAFLCMLAYYVSFELRARLTPLLFDDETPRAPTDPVSPAQRSPHANAKAGSARTEHGYPAHTLPDLLDDLGTLCRNTLRIGPAEHTFTPLTTPTDLQTTALQLLGTKLKT